MSNNPTPIDVTDTAVITDAADQGHDPTPKDVQIPTGKDVVDMAAAAAPKRAPNRKAKNAANAEALAGAKKVAEALDPPAKKAPAKKAVKLTDAEVDAAKVAVAGGGSTSKGVAKKAAAKKAPAAKAAPPAKTLPKPVKLTWETKGDDGDMQQASGARHQYRVREGSSGGFFATQRLAKGGKWVHVAGRCETVAEAQELAGMVEAGATWLSYQTMVNVPYAKVIETYKASK